MPRARDLVRNVEAVDPDAGMPEVAAVMRDFGVSVVPVVGDGRLIGLVSEADLRPSGSAEGPGQPGAFGPSSSARTITRTSFPTLDALMTSEEALAAFSQTDLAALPLIEGGRFRGMVRAADLVAGPDVEPRPQHVAGLATPNGVLLSADGLRGGASDLSIAMTGVVLVLCVKLAEWGVTGIAWLAQRATGLPFLGAMQSPPLFSFHWMDLVVYGRVVVEMLLFLLFLRYSPITRNHGAEHEVVHAIESGESLTVERVRRLSPVHPRCGTNLLAALFALIAASRLLKGTLSLGLYDVVFVTCVIFIVMGWRTLGSVLQKYFTTRRPSVAQAERAIAAANELLRRHQERPPGPPGLLQLVWSRGFIQVMVGAGVATYLTSKIAEYVPLFF
jgi:CBS domain-containing protein